MEKEIPENILKNTIRCDHKNCCHSTEWESCSNVDTIVDDELLNLEDDSGKNKMLNCKYYIPFGGEHYCSCPTRIEIYKKYKI